MSTFAFLWKWSLRMRFYNRGDLDYFRPRPICKDPEGTINGFPGEMKDPNINFFKSHSSARMSRQYKATIFITDLNWVNEVKA